MSFILNFFKIFFVEPLLVEVVFQTVFLPWKISAQVVKNMES